MRKFYLLCSLFLLLFFTKIDAHAEEHYQFLAEDFQTPLDIPYTGEVCGVDIYGATSEQLNVMLPWIQQISVVWNVDDVTVVVNNNYNISLNQLIFKNLETGMLEASPFYTFGEQPGIRGLYTQNRKWIVLDGNMDLRQLQLALVHEFGHHVDCVYGRPSNLLDSATVTEIENLAVEYSTNNTPVPMSQAEAFAELFVLQQCGVWPT